MTARQLNLEGDYLRMKGMERALLGVPGWTQKARRVALTIGLKRDFTSEDVTAEVGLPRQGDINANNAIGALLSQLASSGLVHRVGHVHSDRPQSHARLISVWRLTASGLTTAREMNP